MKGKAKEYEKKGKQQTRRKEEKRQMQMKRYRIRTKISNKKQSIKTYFREISKARSSSNDCAEDAQSDDDSAYLRFGFCSIRLCVCNQDAQISSTLPFGD